MRDTPEAPPWHALPARLLAARERLAIGPLALVAGVVGQAVAWGRDFRGRLGVRGGDAVAGEDAS